MLGRLWLRLLLVLGWLRVVLDLEKQTEVPRYRYRNSSCNIRARNANGLN
jgi:hypothetical protein